MKRSQLDNTVEQAVSHNRHIRKQVLLEKNDMPGLVQLALARFPPGEITGGHHHDDLHEVFFVLAGSGEIQVDQYIETLQPGGMA